MIVILGIILCLQVGAGSLADLHTDRFADLPAHKVLSSDIIIHHGYHRFDHDAGDNFYNDNR